MDACFTIFDSGANMVDEFDTREEALEALGEIDSSDYAMIVFDELGMAVECVHGRESVES